MKEEDVKSFDDYEDVKSFGDYLSALRRRKRQLVFPMVILILITIAVALGLPSVYRSSATILIEQQDIPSDLVRTTITTFADQRLQIITQRVMTTSNLMKIVNKYDLYKEDFQKKTKEEVLEQMRVEDIEFSMLSARVIDPRSGRPMSANIAFTLAFNSESPSVAQKVANELVSLYLNENLRSRKEKTAETSSFLIDEGNRLSNEISELEKKLAIFKQENEGQLPQLLDMNMTLMQRTEREIQNKDQQIQSLEERKIYIESQLSSTDPNADVYSVTGERILGVDARLKTAEAHYITMSATYGPDHPDIIKLRKEIESLKKEMGGSSNNNEELYNQLEALKAELASTREKYSNEHPDAKKIAKEIAGLEESIITAQKEQAIAKLKDEREPDNPVYIQLTTSLETIKSEVKAALDAREKLADKLKIYEDRITRTPQVEREYRNITRDYNAAASKYAEIKSKQMAAQLAEELEKSSKGERFSLIEPPLFPEKPDKPNRLTIFFLGFILSIAGGIGTVAIAESADHGVRGAKRVAYLLGAKPLAVIPYIVDDDDIKKSKRSRLIFLLILLGAIVSTLVAIHFLFKPLDVLWFVLMRKLDIYFL